MLYFLISIIPSILLGIFIYKKDTQEKEPISLLIKLFLGGILSIIITLVIEEGIIDNFITIDEDKLNIIGTILYNLLYVGCVEEFSKWIILKLFTWKNKEFNYLYDGLVYAAFVTLGFATIENILYVFENGLVTGLIRAVASVPGHFFFGILMGYFFSKAKEAQVLGNKDKVVPYLLISYLVPSLLHGTFDTLLSLDSGTAIVVYIIFLIALYIISFRLILKLSKITTDLGGLVKSNQQIRYNNNITEKEFDKEVNNLNNGLIDYQKNNNIPVMNSPIIPNVNFCSNCGKRLNGGNYCSNCGHKIS